MLCLQNLKLLTFIFSLFFVICTSGFLYVFLTEAQLAGYTMNENRTLVESDVYLDSLMIQFGLESFYSAFFISYFILTTFALYYLITHDSDKVGKCKHLFLRIFVLSSIFAIYQLILLIKEKNNSYSPSIFPSFERKYAKYSSENQE